jgi:peptidyl-Lys metalloendopeptidase
MRQTLRIAAVLCTSVLAACAADLSADTLEQDARPQDIQLALSLDQSSYAANQGVFATVSVTNTARHPVKVLNWVMPQEELEEAIFKVEGTNGRAEWIGPHYKRPPARGEDFETLAAGATVSRVVDLQQFYDLTASGEYAIAVEIDAGILHGGKGKISSNTVVAHIEGRAFEPGDLSAGLTYSGRCSLSQQDLISQAVSAATNMSHGALNYLQGGTVGPRYTTWFGAYTASRYSTATSHFVSITDAFDTKNINVDCKCKKNYYAYVYPTQPYNIYVCRAFWNAPMTGTDSKGGTLIHEMSHFNVTAGTDDVVYGQSGCKSLAISDPNGALNNADSHEYFSENTPFQN